MRRVVVVVCALATIAIVGGHAVGQEGAALSAGAPMTDRELAGEIARREADLARYNERLSRLESETAGIRSDLERREAELGAQESQVRRRIVTLCRLRQGGYLHLLRGASSLTDLMRRARYARSLANADLASLREHQRLVAELEGRRADLASQIETQRQLRERIATYRDELEAERRRRLEPPDPFFDDVTAEAPAAPFDPALGPSPWIDL
jgi:flagellar motility protein MotE (MotC chaperone)